MLIYFDRSPLFLEHKKHRKMFSSRKRLNQMKHNFYLIFHRCILTSHTIIPIWIRSNENQNCKSTKLVASSLSFSIFIFRVSLHKHNVVPVYWMSLCMVDTGVARAESVGVPWPLALHSPLTTILSRHYLFRRRSTTFFIWYFNTLFSRQVSKVLVK